MYANVQIMWNDIPLAYAPIYKELFNSRNTRMSQKYLYPSYHEAFPESEYVGPYLEPNCLQRLSADDENRL